MTPAVERLVRQAVEQGHPAKVDDPRVLRNVATLLRSTPRKSRGGDAR